MTWQQLIMYLVGIGLIYLGIKKKLEPALLIPLGFGAILVNLPGSSCGNGIIGAADGPTAILVSKSLNSQYSGQITLAAYSYIALIPLIQPFVAKLITTSKERKIPVQKINQKQISVFARIAFPIAVTFITGFISPHSAQLVGFIMFGNLIRECGVLNLMAETARTTLTNLITILLGITISFTLKAQDFVQLFQLLPTFARELPAKKILPTSS